MRAGLIFIRVGLTQQQVDFDCPKVCAIVRMAIRVHRAIMRATIHIHCIHHIVGQQAHRNRSDPFIMLQAA
jgi:hypothetical protein